MRRFLRQAPSPATIIAIVALVLAMGAVGHAQVGEPPPGETEPPELPAPPLNVVTRTTSADIGFTRGDAGVAQTGCAGAETLIGGGASLLGVDASQNQIVIYSSRPAVSPSDLSFPANGGKFGAWRALALRLTTRPVRSIDVILGTVKPAKLQVWATCAK